MDASDEAPPLVGGDEVVAKAVQAGKVLRGGGARNRRRFIRFWRPCPGVAFSVLELNEIAFS